MNTVPPKKKEKQSKKRKGDIENEDITTITLFNTKVEGN